MRQRLTIAIFIILGCFRAQAEPGDLEARFPEAARLIADIAALNQGFFDAEMVLRFDSRGIELSNVDAACLESNAMEPARPRNAANLAFRIPSGWIKEMAWSDRIDQSVQEDYEARVRTMTQEFENAMQGRQIAVCECDTDDSMKIYFRIDSRILFSVETTYP